MISTNNEIKNMKVGHLIAKTKITFGKQLRSYRKMAVLSQEDFATFMGTGKSYISDLETGNANPTFEILIEYTAFFGVTYYELGNPKFPIPPFDQLPKSSRTQILILKEQQLIEKAKAAEEKAERREKGEPGRAKQLHELVTAGFFKKPRTAKDVFTKLHQSIKKTDDSQYQGEISKLTSTLSSGRFVKLLDKLNSLPGSVEVRFVERVIGAVNYPVGAGDTGDMADDGE